MAIKGLVMSIQRFSLHDGPGVRTTAFLMGCNLRCRWCHNPESFLMKRRMMFYQNRCVGCGRCVTLCNRSAHVFAEDGHHMDPSRCIGCNRLEACAQICPAEAMVMCGKEYTPEELVRLLAKDRVFYAEDGGVTFSGGEALLQDEFLSECLRRCKAQGLHTCVDTAANVEPDKILRVAQYTDLFLVDLKAMDPLLHKKLCGVENRKTIENIRLLGEMGKLMWIRIPLVRGENAKESELRAMARFLRGVPTVERVDVFPVLNHAQDKYRALGMKSESFNEGGDDQTLIETAIRILEKESDGGLKLNRLM